MDLFMPELDGFQTVEKIIEVLKEPTNSNKSANFCKTPTEIATEAGITIIALTSACIDDDMQERILSCGMKHIVEKPMKSSDIDRLIEMECNNECHDDKDK